MGQDNYPYVLLLALQDNTKTKIIPAKKSKPKFAITESCKSENTSSSFAFTF